VTRASRARGESKRSNVGVRIRERLRVVANAMADASQLPRRIIKVRVDGARARATRRTSARARGGRRGDDAERERRREKERGRNVD